LDGFCRERKWGQPVKLAIQDLISKWGLDDEGFASYASSVGLATLDDSDALAYLTVAIRSRSAYKLTKLQADKSISQLVHDMEIDLNAPLSEVSEAAIETWLTNLESHQHDLPF
jgi:hypothetical protein